MQMENVLKLKANILDADGYNIPQYVIHRKINQQITKLNS